VEDAAVGKENQLMADNKRIPGVDDEESIQAMRKRHLLIGLQMQKLAAIALAELDAKAAAGQPLGLSATEAKNLMDVGTELERGALGEKSREKKVQ
jgi:hypothetical protein